jgi:hypothetical protein
MADTIISDGTLASSVVGTEEWPVSGSGKPTINGNLLKELFGTWATWTITFGGFSADPTYTARYCVIGKLLFLQVNCTVNGTSNDTSFTMSLPGSYVAKTGLIQASGGVSAINNGVAVSTVPRIVTASGSATLTITRDPIGTAWTASGGKRVSFSIFIEID